MPLPAEKHHVVWSTPAGCPADLMPLGNGELGINAGFFQNGDLVVYFGRNDSFSEVSQLCKVGKIRISFTPQPDFTTFFRQELCLQQGLLKLSAGRGDTAFEAEIFVDAEYPVVHVTGQSATPVKIRVHVESWRREPREVSGESVWTLAHGPEPIVEGADHFPEVGNHAVCWFHRNESSPAFAATVALQGLESIQSSLKDVLIHRTFGGWVEGRGFVAADSQTLESKIPQQDYQIRVACPCAQTETAAAWMDLACGLMQKSSDAGQRKNDTMDWWADFWDKSWVDCDITGMDPSAGTAASPTGETRHGLFLGQESLAPHAGDMTFGKAHTLQRYMQACAGRSAGFPIKFNGSLFTVEPTALGIAEDADWRRWGDCYWWQNTRMPYHTMPASGDFDQMLPLFDFFQRLLPFAEARSRLYHAAKGSYFGETITAWGCYANRDYGWDRTGKSPSDVDCPYWRYAWNQGLELVALMLDYFDHTEDERFLAERLVPMAVSVLEYFDTRFAKDGAGRIVLDPTQSVETYWHDVVNDTPCVAGLLDITTRLCEIPERLLPADARQFFLRMKSAAPPIPFEQVEADGQMVRRIAVAEKYNPLRSNCENPELFPIWPFRVIGIGHENYEEARNAYRLRASRNDVGWGYDSNAAALLGLSEEAARMLRTKIINANAAYRWPATWGPNFDWLPDQCHGGNLMTTMHTMLLQHRGNKILLFPAWPQDWDVSFKLNTTHRTRVEAALRNGRITFLKTTPENRARDIVLPEGWSCDVPNKEFTPAIK